MATPVLVRLDSADVSCHVLDPAEISWGRSFGQHPDAAQLAFTLTPHGGADPPVPSLGARVTVDLTPAAGPAYRRFVGSVSDVAVSYAGPGPAGALVAVLAVDPLALLAGMTVAAPPWPAETAGVRLARICDAVASTYPGTAGAAVLASTPQLLTSNAPQLAALPLIGTDVDSRTALDLLRDLADTLDAYLWHWPAPADDPATGWGGVELRPLRWIPAGDPWPLDPCLVPADPLRWWSNRTTILNSVTVGYGVPAEGEPALTVTVTDEASVRSWLPRPVTRTTLLAARADAAALAERAVAALSSPLAGLDAVRYAAALDDPSPSLWEAMRARLTGTLLTLASPAGPRPQSWVIESGTDELHADMLVRTVALTDSAAYVASLPWDSAGTGPASTWDDTPPALAWNDVRDRWPA